jgi:hypothetical protein
LAARAGVVPSAAKVNAQAATLSNHQSSTEMTTID